MKINKRYTCSRANMNAKETADTTQPLEANTATRGHSQNILTVLTQPRGTNTALSHCRSPIKVE